jgi:hypothetical protein
LSCCQIYSQSGNYLICFLGLHHFPIRLDVVRHPAVVVAQRKPIQTCRQATIIQLTVQGADDLNKGAVLWAKSERGICVEGATYGQLPTATYGAETGATVSTVEVVTDLGELFRSQERVSAELGAPVAGHGCG